MKKIYAALFGLLCFPLQPLQASGLRLYSQIQEDWTTVYSSDRPRTEGLFKTLKDLNVIGPAPDDGQVSGGGWGDDDDQPSTPPSMKTTVTFPVHSFSGNDYKQLLQTSSDLAILKLKIDDFIGFGPKGDKTVEDPFKAQSTLNDMKHAIEVERAVIALGFYLQSPNLGGKCRNAEDMKALQKTLLSRTEDFTQINASWIVYKKSVLEALKAVLSAIPASVCTYRTVVNKAQTDQWLSDAIDTAVSTTMKKHLDDYTKDIEANNNKLGQDWNQSATDVSLRPLFSVQRGFQNAMDILSLVERDSNGLAGVLATLNEKAGSLKNSGPQSIASAEADLKTFHTEVSKFMLLLKTLPSSPGLGSLSSCQLINPDGTFLSMQKPMQDCLGQLITVYKQNVTTPKTSDAATESFAQLLNQIMSKYLKL